MVGQPARRSDDWLAVIRTTPLEAGRRPAQAQSAASLGTPVGGETMALNKNHSEGGGVIVNNTER